MKKVLFSIAFFTSIVFNLKSQGICYYPGAADNYSFSATSSANYQSIITGDINFDNNVDIIVGFQDSIFTRLGNGDGTFGMINKYLVGYNPKQIIPIDISGDSKQDLIVASANDNQVSVLINGGSGDFLPYTGYNVGAFPVAISVGDFDQDGDRDIASLNNIDQNVSILLNTGSGSFSPGSAFTVGVSGLGSMACMDINNDGKKDLVISNNSNTLYILPGNGIGGFGTLTTKTLNYTAYNLLTTDINADGKEDLLYCGYNDNSMNFF